MKISSSHGSGRHQHTGVFTLTRGGAATKRSSRGSLLLLHQRVLLHPAHQLGRVIRKSPKDIVQSDTPPPPTTCWEKTEIQQVPERGSEKNPLALKQHILVSETPRTRKPPPAAQPSGSIVPPVSQAVVRGYKDPPSADKIGCTIIPEKREPKKPILKDPPKSLAKQPSTPPPDYPSR